MKSLISGSVISVLFPVLPGSISMTSWKKVRSTPPFTHGVQPIKRSLVCIYQAVFSHIIHLPIIIYVSNVQQVQASCLIMCTILNAF